MQRTLARRAGTVALTVPTLLGALLSGCKGSNTPADTAAPAAAPAAPTPAPPATTTAAANTNTADKTAAAPPTAAEIAAVQKQTAPIVTMVTDKGTILIKLFPKDAPITCANFENLVQKGFYNGLTFHRYVPGFVIQGGDPKGDGSGGPGYSIKGEFTANGVNNPLSHNVGAVAMARSGDQTSGFDTAGSQFYITLAPANNLDGQYAVFGQVIKGQDVAESLRQDDKMTSVTLKK